MKNVTLGRMLVCLLLPVSLSAVACGGGEDPITADNVTLEQCEELFGEADEAPAAGGSDDGAVEGDYDDDGDADDDDDAIKERCDELMAEDDGSAE